jgi:beta-mannosidase
MKLDLNSGWKLKHADLYFDAAKTHEVLAHSDEWMEVTLPCDVHMPLISNKLIKDPVLADYSFDCEWIEKRSWWFMKQFDVADEMLRLDALELVFEMLDAEADIYFNGMHLGHHRSAFRPFTADVKSLVKSSGNVILVRLTTGIERYSDNDLAGIWQAVNTEADFGRGDRGDKRRVLVRKPQYCYGWDWCPRIATCGITAPVYMIGYDKVAIRRLCYDVESIGSPAILRFEAEIESLRPISTIEAVVSLQISIKGRELLHITKEILLKSGLNYIPFTVKIHDPMLWWPNGMGSQPLYDAELTVFIAGEEKDSLKTRFGIRTVELDLEKLDVGEYCFAFRVNGIRMFCKGANWIPADSIYARVTDDKYAGLLQEAAEGNLNMLRIWGGGLYERDIFYNLCDEYGLLVWQDFMFACAAYPDALEWFRHEVEQEMEYQTRRLSNHPCLAVWCGNNENAQCFDELWLGSKRPAYMGGMVCYNRLAPAIVHRNCPGIPYWNSSPYGGEYPNSSQAGDKHHWNECMMNTDMEKRITPEEYDKITARFISEYGYPGPCRKVSIEKYLDGAPMDRESSLWAHHNNKFEKFTVNAGITKHYRNADGLSMDEYLLYASLCQGLMLGYSLESLRMKEYCWGALYWMYNDCWGETGWTTIDYYMIRKPSYYFVKRAFEPVKLILRARDGIIRVTGINDTAEEYSFEVEYGYISFNGKECHSERSYINLPPFSRQVVLSFPLDSYDTLNGCYFVKPIGDKTRIQAAILKTTEFKNLRVPKAVLTISDFIREEDSIHFNVTSDVFAHAVHFNLPYETKLNDEYFDLLPGQVEEITAEGITCDLNASDIVCSYVR